MNKPVILVSYLDEKFIDEIICLLELDFTVIRELFDENDSEISMRERQRRLDNVDIIICEWCGLNAVWYSKCKLSNQKLFIRLHRYELFTDYFYKVNWKNVCNLIFISNHMKKMSNMTFLQRKILCKDNFDHTYYISENPHLFNDKRYLNCTKEWAWQHWLKYGKEISHRKPIVKTTCDINESICDEFSHFNGGIVIHNYIKSSMFTSLPKTKDSEFHVGMMGILPKLKRPDIAVDILYALVQKDKRYKLFILSKKYTEWIGTSERQEEIQYYENLQNKIQHLGLEMNVIYDNYSNSPHIWFQNISYILSVSDIEGSHQAIAEGMASNTIPFIFGKALKTCKLDDLYPKQICFYDSLYEVVDKIIYYTYDKVDRLRNAQFCNQFAQNYAIKNIYHQYKDLIHETF